MIINDKNTAEFVLKFNKLKKVTRNFSNVSYRFILTDPTYISVFRVIFGVTTNFFAKMVGLPYSWVYNLEHCKVKIGVKGAQNLASKINKLFKVNNYSYEIDNILKNYYSLYNIYIKSDISKRLDNLEKTDFEDFFKFFDYLHNITFNFSKLNNVILEDSRVILLFRLILGLSQKEFADRINMGKMTVEELERGYRKIKFPTTAKHYALKIEKLVSNFSINKDILKENWFAWKNTRRIFENKRYNWKTIRYMTQKDFVEYLIEVKKLTNNFAAISPDLFQKSPQLILVFRVMLGITQKELERKANLRCCVSGYENLVYKNLNRGNSELLAKYFKSEFLSKNISKLNNSDLIDKFLFVKDSMFVHNNNFSPKFTGQEKCILKLLKNMKIKGLEILTHHNMNTNRGILNVDFLLKLGNKPMVVIECTEAQTSSKKFSYNIKRRVYEIDYRFTKIKRTFPQLRTILVLSVYEDDLIKYRLKSIIKNQTVAIDDTFINDEVISLPKLLNGRVNLWQNRS